VTPFEFTQYRPEPPFRTAHWEYVSDDEVLWFNCDGIRTDVFAPTGSNGNWGVVAVMPGSESDVDLRLHEDASGARSGFGVPLVSTRWGKGESDFVLMNFHNTSLRQFEVGVVQGGVQKVQDYAIVVRGSFLAATDPNGEVATHYLTSSDIMKILEIRFTTAAYYRATLTATNPAMDLGFSLYGSETVFGNKEDVLAPEAAAWLEPAGAAETFDFTVEPGMEGSHCLAVWKVGNADLPLEGSYTVTIDQLALVPVAESDLPKVTGLGAIYPNPFNPQTTIEFTQVERGRVSVSVFDLSGSRVRRLVDENRSVGRHKVVWDGRDDGGRRVASGTYMVSMSAGDVRQTKKLMLVK
jgi:hypothetical protein